MTSTNSPVLSADPDRPTPDPAPGRPAIVWAAAAGVVAAGAALATGEVMSGLTDRIPSLVIGVAEIFVDETPGGIVRWSIETFGASQKTLLVWGITLAALLAGALLGVAGAKNRRLAVTGYAGFAILGGWAAGRAALSSNGLSWLSAILSAVVGAGVLVLLLDRLPGGARNRPGEAVGPAQRRAFLGVAGAAAFWAVFGTGLGRSLRRDQSVEGAREQVATQLGGTPSGGAVPSPAGSLDGSVEGISTLITPSDDFYLIDTALRKPQVDPADWTLRITGMVDDEIELTFDDLLAMDQIEETITLSCVSNEVGGTLVGNAVWTGVRLSTLLDMAGIRPGADQILGRSVDGWTGGFPTEVALDGRPAMVALTMNGEPLPVEHGFPARLVVPGLYGYVSATKWLSEIELTTWEGEDGYWISRGWAKEGPVKTQSRIDVPRDGQNVAAGRMAIAGVAWAPHRSIDRVEVRVDGGEWLEARLSVEFSQNAWRQWVVEYDAAPGDHQVEVRATDGDGQTQPEERTPVAPSGATGWHTIAFRAEAI